MLRDLIEYSQIVEYYGYIKDTFKDAMTKLIFYVSVYGPEHFWNENALYEHEPIRLLARKYSFDFS